MRTRYNPFTGELEEIKEIPIVRTEKLSSRLIIQPDVHNVIYVSKNIPSIGLVPSIDIEGVCSYYEVTFKVSDGLNGTAIGLPQEFMFDGNIGVITIGAGMIITIRFDTGSRIVRVDGTYIR